MQEHDCDDITCDICDKFLQFQKSIPDGMGIIISYHHDDTHTCTMIKGCGAGGGGSGKDSASNVEDILNKYSHDVMIETMINGSAITEFSI